MKTLSTRYVVPLLALLTPACFAVWVYSYGGFRSDDCADPAALLETAWIEGLESRSEPDRKRSAWVLQEIGGTVATKSPGISPLEFKIIRSFELDRLYGNPVSLIPRGDEFVLSSPTLEWIGSQGDRLPIRKIVLEAPGIARIAAYTFLYDSRPVANPSLALLSAMLARIATGRRPLTHITLSVDSSSHRRSAAERLAEEWLVSAWEYYRSVCRP